MRPKAGGLSTRFLLYRALQGTALRMMPSTCCLTGVLAHVLGSALHSWRWPRIGRQVHRPEVILANIWQRTKELELYAQHAVAGTRLANLHLKMFVEPNAPFRQPPFLKTKAGETKHLLPIVACIAHERDDVSPEAGRLCKMLDAMVALTKLFGEAAVVPSATDSQQAKSYIKPS